MTAISAFAPTPRNRFLRKVVMNTSTINHRALPTLTVTTTAFALFLWILSFWRRQRKRRHLPDCIDYNWFISSMMTSFGSGRSCCTSQLQQHLAPIIQEHTDSRSPMHYERIRAMIQFLRQWVIRKTEMTTQLHAQLDPSRSCQNDSDIIGNQRILEHDSTTTGTTNATKWTSICSSLASNLKTLLAFPLGNAIPPAMASTTAMTKSPSTPPTSSSASTIIQENRQLIHQVLMYWFGQYQPDQSQRQLWMIASSSVELRTRVDAEITAKFASLLLDLASDRSESSTTATTIVGPTNNNHCQERMLNQWTNDTTSYGYHGKVAAIIVLDQMSRHVRRCCYFCDTAATTMSTIPTTKTKPVNGADMATTKVRANSCSVTNSLMTSDPELVRLAQQYQQLIPEQGVLDQLAYQVSLQFRREHSVEITCGLIPLPMHVFALMPLRHHASAASATSSSIPTMAMVQDEIEQIMAPLQPQMQALVQRFRKATNRRMAVLQDEARRGGGNFHHQERPENERDPQQPSLPLTPKSNINDISHKTDSHLMGGDSNIDDDDILEHVFFEADMSHSHQHPVHKAIVQFLALRSIVPITIDGTAQAHDTDEADSAAIGDNTTGANTTTKHRQINGNFLPQLHAKGEVAKNGAAVKSTSSSTVSTTDTTGMNDPSLKRPSSNKATAKHYDDPAESTSVSSSFPSIAPMIVSLSGGVDSMVVATVLAHLRDNCNYPHLRVLAVHIDYANRPESGAEAEFCSRYCQRVGIDFTCRRIGEVTRGITARDEYERRAREIRFQEYRKAISKSQRVMENGQKTINHNDRNEDDNAVVVGVVLGHHRGDLRENVLSNAHKGCGPLDLSGMTEVSQNDGVTLYRPLLKLEKTAIFDYAHKFGVPYFKDTTPHWSTRGKLRNQLLPLLEEIYGEGSMNNLSSLAHESDEARSLLYHTVLGPFLNQVSRRAMGIYFDTAPWKLQGVYFWKLVLREALHTSGLGMFKDKSVASFCERIQAAKLRAGWLQCRRDYAVYLQGDGRVFVLYPESFPWRKGDAFSSFVGRVVPYGVKNVAFVGPWSVTSELVESTSDVSIQNRLLGLKAVKSMEDFMDGHIEYYMRVTSDWDSINQEFAPRPLEIISDFTRGSRPLAWKSCDLKIQCTLPILGYDSISGNDAIKDRGNKAENFRLVKVTLKLTVHC